MLAEWDTMVSHKFAVRAIEHLRSYRNDRLPDKIVLTFIEFEQSPTPHTPKIFLLERLESLEHIYLSQIL